MIPEGQLSLDDALDGVSEPIVGDTAATWADVFGLEEGRARRDEGMARTEAADRDGIDKHTIDCAIDSMNVRYEGTGLPWSANDIRDLCRSVRQPLIGARIRAAARAGRIVHVGYTPSNLPSTHAHDLKTWRAAP